MSNEIKEILEYWNFYINEPNNYKLLNVHFDEIKKVLDYITSLQKTNKNHSKKLIELGDEITNLKEENEKLKENKLTPDELANLLNQELIKQRDDYKLRNEKAIEFIKEKISSTQGVINDYMYHKEHNKILIELLQEDIDLYKKELNILNDGDEK